MLCVNERIKYENKTRERSLFVLFFTVCRRLWFCILFLGSFSWNCKCFAYIIHPYLCNRVNQLFKKIKIRFNCMVYDGPNSLEIKDAEAIIAVAFKN